MKRTQGFTLVELLVVIAIIGILVGLLLPAIGAMRERSRNMDCSNRVRQLALAALQYQTSKGRLPGYVHKFGIFPGGPDPTDPGNYAASVPRHIKVGGYGVALLPFVDAQPTYEHWSQDRYPVICDGMGSFKASFLLSGSGFHPLAAPNLAAFQCPSNPNKDGSHGLNSYTPNNGMSHIRVGAGQIRNFRAAEARNNGVFNTKYVGTIPADPNPHCGRSVGPDMTLEDVKDGKASTMLFAENVQALPWHRPGFLDGPDLLPVNPGDTDLETSDALMLAKFTNGVVWHYEDTNYTTMPNLPADTACGIPAPVGCAPVNTEHEINGAGRTGPGSIFTRIMTASDCVDLARPSSAHVDGFNAAFADGATRYITATIDYRTYQALLTTRGKGSDVPFREFVITDEIEQ